MWFRASSTTMLSSAKGISYDCRRGFSSLSGSNRVALIVIRFSLVATRFSDN
jgi:hypothetical protein